VGDCGHAKGVCRRKSWALIFLILFQYTPCPAVEQAPLRDLLDEVARPLSLFGPVDLRAFLLLALVLAVEDIGSPSVFNSLIMDELPLNSSPCAWCQ